MTVKRKKKVFVPLCFTAEGANSTVQLNKNGNPAAVELETSTDGITWTDYTIGSSITLANVGDKVYMRNKSEIDTGFTIDSANYYQFSMTGKIGASGDITSLMNKNGTTTLTEKCYNILFSDCTSLTTAPELPATTLGVSCYSYMFYNCTNLTTAPELPATTLANYCYNHMFYGCTSIKLSETQTGEYQIPYRIPTTGTGTTANNSLLSMFNNTGGTFTGTPTINTTYYLSNGGSVLLSYEEIKAMRDNAMQTGQTSDLLPLQTELNKYPSDYYNKFKSENKIAILEGEQGSGEYSPVLDPDGTAIWKTGLFINNARTYWDYI